jgi:hypothetical protein
MPTANHVFYIPAILAIGFFLGLVYGRRSMLADLAAREARERKLQAIAEGREG